MKNDRLFQLLYILLARHSTTANELATTLEVSTRTIYRDVETLSRAGVPIYTSVGKGGGISLVPGYIFDKALLSDTEQDQILFAIQSLQAAGQEVGALLQKLGSVFQKANADWIEVDFSRWGMQSNDNARFGLLKTAILERRILHLRYCGASGKISERDVAPTKLIFKQDHWYLQAFCLQAQDYRSFKLSRMLLLTPTGRFFPDDLPPPPPLDTASPAPKQTAPLKLQFSARMAFRVYDEFDRSHVTEQSDGSFLVATYFPLDDWLVGYLLSFGTDVIILEPPILRTSLAQRAKEILLHYKT